MTPTPTKPQTACPTMTETYTLTSIVTLPGTGIVVTLTETMLTASTLLSIHYPDPATFVEPM
jgi:hypothetical protein